VGFSRESNQVVSYVRSFRVRLNDYAMMYFFLACSCVVHLEILE
jgi:hypothetical protein